MALDQASQPGGGSGGGLTDAELRASPVPVLIPVPSPVSGPLTDAELRAVAVPTTPTNLLNPHPVTGPLTDAQLRATPPYVYQQPATNNIQVNGAANAAAVATLPAAGAGLFHYITHIDIQRHSTAALAGGGTLAVTTTNLGGRSWRTGNQASITVGTMNGGKLLDAEFVHPLKSAVANTNTVITCPAAGAAVLWTINVDYYIAP